MSANGHDKKLESALKPDTVLPGNSGSYYVEELLGEGTFGAVARCIKVDTKEVVALKMIHSGLTKSGQREIQALTKLKELDADKHNIIRFFEHFQHEGQFCLTFEMLDLSLFDFLKRRRLIPLHVIQIRAIAQQMLVALEALKSIGLAHIDIKPDNIMLVNHRSQPFKVKLIDFGCATKVSELASKDVIQALGYRAPEVILGLPLTEAVDMWALGSVLATMFLGRHLYMRKSQYEVLRVIVQLHGQPKDSLLAAGRKARTFFTEAHDSPGQAWRIKTADEYQQDTGKAVTLCSSYSDVFTSLDDLPTIHRRPMDATEKEDTKAFISLLKWMLHVDPHKRITPSVALRHRFITRKHLSGETCNKVYRIKASEVVKRCQLEEAAVEPLLPSREVLSFNRSASLERSFPAEEKHETGKKEVEVQRTTGVSGLKNSCRKQDNEITAIPQPQKEKIIMLRAPLEKQSGSHGGTKTEQEPVAILKERPPEKEAVVNVKSAAQNNTERTNQNVQKEEVKTKKKYFRSVRKFFSRVFRCFTCGRGNVN